MNDRIYRIIPNIILITTSQTTTSQPLLVFTQSNLEFSTSNNT